MYIVFLILVDNIGGVMMRKYHNIVVSGILISLHFFKRTLFRHWKDFIHFI